jgi:hypothetical protein
MNLHCGNQVANNVQPAVPVQLIFSKEQKSQQCRFYRYIGRFSQIYESFISVCVDLVRFVFAGDNQYGLLNRAFFPGFYNLPEQIYQISIRNFIGLCISRIKFLIDRNHTSICCRGTLIFNPGFTLYHFFTGLLPESK